MIADTRCVVICERQSDGEAEQHRRNAVVVQRRIV